jgi:hypothetical protein
MIIQFIFEMHVFSNSSIIRKYCLSSEAKENFKFILTVRKEFERNHDWF